MSANGIILKGMGGAYTVKTEDGITVCTVRGIFRKDNISPMVGDLVEITCAATPNGEGNIIKILERKNMLIRPPVANIDQVVVVIAAKSPSPNLFIIDKLLVTLESKNIDAIVCINKIDLDDETACALSKTYADIGYPVLSVSAIAKLGIGEFNDILKDRITAFAGNSGVGKSSILNAVNAEFTLKTGDISDRIQRGKHTTRHVELLPLKHGGFVLDTPGFSSFELDNIKKEDIGACFPELITHSANCRFASCNHILEPDCAVKDALLAGKIASTRYESYTSLYKLISENPNYRN